MAGQPKGIDDKKTLIELLDEIIIAGGDKTQEPGQMVHKEANSSGKKSLPGRLRNCVVCATVGVALGLGAIALDKNYQNAQLRQQNIQLSKTIEVVKCGDLALQARLANLSRELGEYRKTAQVYQQKLEESSQQLKLLQERLAGAEEELTKYKNALEQSGGGATAEKLIESNNLITKLEAEKAVQRSALAELVEKLARARNDYETLQKQFDQSNATVEEQKKKIQEYEQKIAKSLATLDALNKRLDEKQGQSEPKTLDERIKEYLAQIDARIAIATGQSLCIYDSTGLKEIYKADTGGQINDLHWSPDGNSLFLIETFRMSGNLCSEVSKYDLRTKFISKIIKQDKLKNSFCSSYNKYAKNCSVSGTRIYLELCDGDDHAYRGWISFDHDGDKTSETHPVKMSSEMRNYSTDRKYEICLRDNKLLVKEIASDTCVELVINVTAAAWQPKQPNGQ